MTDWALLAPGPSATQAIADSLRGAPLGVVGNAFELAPWADFLAATDMNWWRRHPAAKDFAGKRYSCHGVTGVKRVRMPTVNSGVLALECAKNLGATTIRLYGFDMHGSHFFGPYTNGLSNTTPDKRKVHFTQYAKWQRQNARIQVINCTPGSALKCFPFDESLDATA